jgi:hypothetical protein
MLPGDVQEVHVLDSRQIVNQNSDKKPHLETMSEKPLPGGAKSMDGWVAHPLV